MHRCLVISVVFTALVAGAAAVAEPAVTAGPRWAARDLGTLGGRWSTATALDEHGNVVGWSRLAPPDEPYQVRRAFVSDRKTMRELLPTPDRTVESTAIAISKSGAVLVGSVDLELHEPILPAILVWDKGRITRVGSGWAEAINERNEVVWCDFVAYEECSAFLRRAGRTIGLGTLAGRAYSAAYDINDRGQVVGAAYDVLYSGSFSHARPRAFLWQRGPMIDLGVLPATNGCEATTINERGQVVGTCTMGKRTTGVPPEWESGAPIGFVWRGGRMTRLPGVPVAINDHGQVVGTKGSRAFVWQAGKTTLLPALRNGAKAAAVAINERGQVLGRSGGHVVVWQGGRLSDLGGGAGVAINDGGQVAGARNGHATLWTPIGA